MYDIAIDADQDPATFYDDLIQAADALTYGEPDGVANMANVAALLWQGLPNLNWAGFYRLIGEELVLGPFQGKPACIRIPIGKGVCGSAVERREAICVEDVHAFPGHIACDVASRSELVVPLISDGKVIGVIDLDSPLPSRFGADDLKGLSRLAEMLANRVRK